MRKTLRASAKQNTRNRVKLFAPGGLGGRLCAFQWLARVLHTPPPMRLVFPKVIAQPGYRLVKWTEFRYSPHDGGLVFGKQRMKCSLWLPLNAPTYGEWLMQCDDEGHAWGTSVILARHGCEVAAHEKATVIALGDARVTLYDQSQCYAFDDARVFAHDHSKVEAHNVSKADLFDHAQGVRYDDADMMVHSDDAQKTERDAVHVFDAESITTTTPCTWWLNYNEKQLDA